MSEWLGFFFIDINFHIFDEVFIIFIFLNENSQAGFTLLSTFGLWYDKLYITDRVWWDGNTVYFSLTSVW